MPAKTFLVAVRCGVEYLVNLIVYSIMDAATIRGMDTLAIFKKVAIFANTVFPAVVNTSGWKV